MSKEPRKRKEECDEEKDAGCSNKSTCRKFKD
uniref:Uncharacterized protein n=1 Tax=Arundo donax TaxID=35708 RepID=A0A0A9HFJ9_ARUDO